MQIVMSTPYDDIDSSLIDCIHIIRLYKYLSSSNLAVIHKTVVRKLIVVIRNIKPVRLLSNSIPDSNPIRESRNRIEEHAIKQVIK